MSGLNWAQIFWMRLLNKMNHAVLKEPNKTKKDKSKITVPKLTPIYEYKIKRNSATCKMCNTKMESKEVCDVIICNCGRIAIDGGNEYLKRLGDLECLEETSSVISSQSDA